MSRTKEEDLQAAAATAATTATAAAAAMAVKRTVDLQELKTPEDIERVTCALLEKGERLFYEDRLFQAHEQYQGAVSLLAELQSSSSRLDLQQAAGEALERVRAQTLLQEVESKVAEILKLLRQFEDDNGWVFFQDSEGIRTFSRSENGTGIHSFKVSGELDVPVQNILACLYEVDLYENWYPSLKFAKELKTVSRFRKLVQLEISVPWPMSNREVISDAFGVDVLEKNQVIICFRSVTQFPGIELPPPRPNVTRALSTGSFLLEPISPNRTLFRLISHVDPQLPVIPNWLLNWFLGKVSHHLVKQLCAAAKFDSTSEYPQRIATNREVYGYIEEQAQRYFEQRKQARKDSPPQSLQRQPQPVSRTEKLQQALAQ